MKRRFRTTRGTKVHWWETAFNSRYLKTMGLTCKEMHSKLNHTSSISSSSSWARLSEWGSLPWSADTGEGNWIGDLLEWGLAAGCDTTLTTVTSRDGDGGESVWTEAEEKTRFGTMFIGYPRKPREELGSSERISQCIGVARENRRKKKISYCWYNSCKSSPWYSSSAS